jgi:hypothetical protein
MVQAAAAQAATPKFKSSMDCDLETEPGPVTGRTGFA